MKKGTIITSIIMTVLILMSSCKSNIKYPSGKDTVESFGDGTFQIVGRDPAGVFYAGEGAPLVSCVKRYYEDGDMIYIFGNERHNDDVLIYGIINASSNAIQIHFTEEVSLSDRLLESPSIAFVQEFSDFSEDSQEIFGKMARGELGKTT